MPPKIDGQRSSSPSSVDGDSTTKNSSSQKRNRGPSDIIMAIKEFGASQIKSDLAQEKIWFIEMENTRRRNKEVRHQNEETRRTEEHRQHQQKTQLEEWEKFRQTFISSVTNCVVIRSMIRRRRIYLKI
jgi:guanylate kinase